MAAGPLQREAFATPPGFQPVMRLGCAGAAIALLSAACTSAGPATTSPSGAPRSAPAAFEVAQIPGGPREDTRSALADPTAAGLPKAPSVDVRRLRSGGPPPDGIPSIDKPRFLRTPEVTFLDDKEPVLALEIDGDARAYPLQVLTWHEIVNDTVGGVPVAVTYCPLCNTALAFDRRLGRRVLSFGTSGLLLNSALVMYDRQTQSLWSHFMSTALVGVLAGQRLAAFPVAVVSWRTWSDTHPSGLVLSRETGVNRPYGRNPYPGYDDVRTPPFLFEGKVDGRLAAKERIVGLALARDPVALRLRALRTRGVLDVQVDDMTLTVWHLPGTTSALDEEFVAGGRDVGATGAFVPTSGKRALTFERDGNEFVDHQTGSRWTILGRAIAGPLKGRQLRPVRHVDTFWFAWAAYWPDTRIEPA